MMFGVEMGREVGRMEKSWDPAYSQTLVQNKIDRQRVKIERVGLADSEWRQVGK